MGIISKQKLSGSLISLDFFDTLELASVQRLLKRLNFGGSIKNWTK